MAGQRIDVDRVILELASRQHGVVARRQLLEAGVPAHRLDRRVKARRLEPLHRGVYRVGPVIAPRANEMAAVLACDGNAVVSHFSATAMWGLLDTPAEEVHVIVARSDHGRRPRIRPHRFRSLRTDEVTRIDGIPVTTPARTLFDLAGMAAARELERATAEAFAKEPTSRAALDALLARYPRHKGTCRLRRLLGHGDPALTRSEAEERFLALVRRGGLTAPEANARVAGYEVDFLWRRERFIVEVDGFAFHSTSRRFERDRTRDAVLAAAGLRVVRVTWRQIVNEPEAMLVRLAQALVR